MPISCTVPDLVSESNCLACSMTYKQLLASLVYVLCEANNMDCTPASLAAASECYRCSMTEKSLLASAVYILCNGGAGGGGTLGGTGAPTGVITPSSDYALYIQTDSVPPGLIWEWYGGVWH